jgi:hypothetical protein
MDIKQAIDERHDELIKELDYQNREKISAENLLKFAGYHLMAIRQHIETIGKELQFLSEIKEGSNNGH